MPDELVLIIDPDDLERRRLRRALGEVGFEVVEAGAAIEGLFETLERDPDVILLAEEVPPLVAGDLLSVLRRLTASPVIIIGSGGDPEEAAALEFGADFYQQRPFSLRVLISRVRSLVRRHRAYSQSSRTMSEVRLEALTPTERKVLSYLVSRYGEPVSVADVVHESYGGAVTAAAAKLALWRLRQKLRGAGLRLIALPRVGYRLTRADLPGMEQAAS